MKTFRILLTSLFTILIPTLAGYTISAQSQPGSDDYFQISPSIVDTKPGNSYELIIENLSTRDRVFIAEPAIFTLDLTSRTLKPLELSEANFSNTDVVKYLKPEVSEIYIPAGKSESVKVNYLNELKGYYFGITVFEKNQDGSNLGFVIKASSIIVNYDLSDLNANDLINDLTIKPDSSFFGVSLGNGYSLKSNITNNSDSLVKASGEIRVKESKTNIYNVTLSQDIAKTIYPGDNINISKNFIDFRNPIKRFGKIRFEQTLILSDGTEISTSKEVISIPLEVLFIFLIILSIVLIIVIILALKGTKFLGKFRVAHTKEFNEV